MDAYAEAMDLAWRAVEADRRDHHGEALVLLLTAHGEVVEALSVGWPKPWPRLSGEAA